MTAPARLLAIRLQGFKSFAERTTIEFGPGISAVVGPNGSGKSNLADALRWTLGEQGRSIRTRRAEDVIWAGSERRSAQGMADVTLVLDNGDGLLPVEYQVVEVGRRLYRSGENEYLLNRQRVRLRDLTDLLDGANLADNAFLFIGQGMVDQALSLRPEERRPLFEEVAGVRRHERRKRRAEEQLTESTANLARVDDILGELRPQARRLAAQAEQQTSRQSAGEELVVALLSSAHVRWHEAAARARSAAGQRARARQQADAAMADLAAAEERLAALTTQLAERAAEERGRRAALDSAIALRGAVAIRRERLAAESDALARDRVRLRDERQSIGADLDNQRRTLATPIPPRDVELEAALAEAERALSEAASELAGLRAADRARGEELAAIRRAETARTAELGAARSRLAEIEGRRAAEAEAVATGDARLAELAAARTTTAEALAAAIAVEGSTAAQREATRLAVEAAEAAAAASVERVGERSAALASRRGRREALDARLEAEERRGIARAARRRGGRRLDEGLVVEPAFRAAVEAALSDVARAYLLPRAALAELESEQGMLMASEAGPGRRQARGGEAATRRLEDRLAPMGGGLLLDAIHRDPVGGASRLLARAGWLPTLAACLEAQSDITPGWILVPRDGRAVVTDLTVALNGADGTIERRAELETLAAEIASIQAEVEAVEEVAARARAEAAEARAAFETSRAAESGATAARRRAEETERQAARLHDAAARELAWRRAQLERAERELEHVRAALAGLESAEREDGHRAEGPPADADTRAAISTWEARATEIRARRDRLADQAAVSAARRGEVESRRARAEATISVREERLSAADRELAALADREQTLAEAREALDREAAAAAAAEAEARRALDELMAADGADRERLAVAERHALSVRDRLRAADDQARVAERAALEADLGVEALREQLLVDLAALGEIALRQLPPVPTPRDPDGQETSALERAEVADETDAALAADEDWDRSILAQRLAAATESWSVEPPPSDTPGSGRLAQLRRRLADLGSANPYAVEEYGQVKARLDELERQRADLAQAIERTRQLIAELSRLIVDQFGATFRALESAFDERFQQLFGGGFARLELTDPDSLGSTGVEITARPPGKRRQPLAMLSGGERSLTAVALLLAMLQVRPVPFCVLDEVDAALDEANVGRFTSALRDLAEQTQFIVITHNRGTIRIADALYGVTVGDDSVSRVISLRLDEADAIAARRRAGAPDAPANPAV